MYECHIHERLLSVVPCDDTTGQGFYKLIQTVLEDNGLTLQNCIADSTDGAANMQGDYNGFTAHLKNENKQHVHIWCYAHILNLVINDLMKGHLKAGSFLGFSIQ